MNIEDEPPVPARLRLDVTDDQKRALLVDRGPVQRLVRQAEAWETSTADAQAARVYDSHGADGPGEYRYGVWDKLGLDPLSGLWGKKPVAELTSWRRVEAQPSGTQFFSAGLSRLLAAAVCLLH